MAFQSQRTASNNNAQANAGNEAWRAQGFLNFYLPSQEEGKRRKLGAIPLRIAKPAEKKLADWLAEDPQRMATLIAHLEVEYQSAEASETNGFALPV